GTSGRGRGGVGAQRAVGGHRAGAGGTARGGARGGGYHRRGDAHPGADASRLPSRRLLHRASAGRVVALLPRAAAGGARAGVGALAGLPGAPAGRRHRGHAGAVDGGDRRHARPRRARLEEADEPVGAALAGAGGRRAGPAGVSRPSPAAGPLWRVRHPAGVRAGEAPVPGRAGPRALRGKRRPQHGAPHPLAHGRIRADAGRRGALRRVAHRPQRLAEHRERPGLVPPLAGRRDRHGRAGGKRRRVPGRSPGAAGPDAAAGAACGRAPPVGALPAGAGAVSRRRGRVQDRLGAQRAHPVEERGVRARGHGAPGRHAGRDRRVGARAAGGKGPGKALRPPRAADAVRPVARAGGQADRLGVLPRAVRLRRRHDEGDRGPGGAVRTGVPRPGPGPEHDAALRAGAPQPEPGGRRHQRGGHDAAPGVLPPGTAKDPVFHARAGAVPVLGLHATRRSGTRDVRLLRRRGRAEAPHHRARPPV
ncbi:MAG: Phytoene dehydrogenase and related proteins, partial [uncultured Gemmatimonadetes bacterium]